MWNNIIVKMNNQCSLKRLKKNCFVTFHAHQNSVLEFMGNSGKKTSSLLHINISEEEQKDLKKKFAAV
jgi:hypothetical protein